MRWILLVLLFCSCAQRIQVPVNRMVSPEAIGRGMDLEYRQMTFSQGLLDFSENRTDNSLEMGSVKKNEMNLGLGISRTVDFFFKIPEQSVSLLGVKVQVIGEPSKARSLGHKLAFTLAMGNNRDTFEGEYDVKLKSDAQEFALIHGYRLSPMILLYDGISVSKYNFEGELENPGPGFSSNGFSYTADSIVGFHGGIELGGPTFKVKAEYGAQRIEWSHTEAKTYHSLGYSLVATF